jgi:hypothetical protein
MGFTAREGILSPFPAQGVYYRENRERGVLGKTLQCQGLFL